MDSNFFRETFRLYAAGANVFVVHAVLPYRRECVHLKLCWCKLSSLNGAGFCEHDLFFSTSCTVYGEAAQVLGEALVFATLCT